jgi:hypothetical protein
MTLFTMAVVSVLGAAGRLPDEKGRRLSMILLARWKSSFEKICAPIS